MTTEAQLRLRERFHKETSLMWKNIDGEPDIDYVEWLEAKMETAQNKVVRLSEALFAEYNKAYSNTKAGQIYPQWFTDEQLRWIETVLREQKIV